MKRIAVTPKRNLIRTAYTIVEVAIVLGILAAFAMLAWPVMMKPWQRNEAQQAAETVREQLSQARISAMTEGHVFQFRWKANTGEYEVRSRDPLPKVLADSRMDPLQAEPSPNQDDTTESVASAENPRQALEALVQGSENHSSEHKRVVHDRLPMDNIFYDSRAIETAFFHDDVDDAGNRKTWTPPLSGSPDDALRQRRDRMQAWKAIDFYPDGRSDNQELMIRSTNGYEVRVELRGFTGGVLVSEPRRVRRQEIDLNNLKDLDMNGLTAELDPESDARDETDEVR